MKRPARLRAAASALILLYLVFAPGVIRRGLNRDPHREYYETPPPQWYGVVEIWHIASFRTWQGSVTDYLSQRAAAFNSLHPGVHVKVLGMSQSGYAQRAARGETPDGYSFASGFLYAEQLQPLGAPLPELLKGVPPAEADGALYAAPYLMSGYGLGVNMQRLYQANLTLPREGNDPAFWQAAASVGGKTPQLAASPLWAAAMGIAGEVAEPKDFGAGDALAGVVDMYALGRVSRDTDAQLITEALPLWNYTDQVFYLGAARNTDRMRREIIGAFALFLLSPQEQARMAQLGAFPVIPHGETEEKAVYSQALLTQWYQGCAEIACPDPFLYQRHRDALAGDALAALSGGEAEQKAFWERFSVVFGSGTVVE